MSNISVMEQCNQNHSGIIRFNKLFSWNGLVYFKLWMYVNISVRENQFEQEKKIKIFMDVFWNFSGLARTENIWQLRGWALQYVSQDLEAWPEPS